MSVTKAGRNPGSLLLLVEKTQLETSNDDSSDSSEDEDDNNEETIKEHQQIKTQNFSTQQKPCRFKPVKLVHQLNGGRWTGQDKTLEPGYQIPNASREKMIRRVKREIKQQKPATAKSRTDIKKMIETPSYQMFSVLTVIPDFAKPVEPERKSAVASPVQSPLTVESESQSTTIDFNLDNLDENGKKVSSFFDQMKAQTLSLMSQYSREIQHLRDSINFYKEELEIVKSFMTDEQKIQLTQQLAERKAYRSRTTSISTHPPTPMSSRHVSSSSYTSDKHSVPANNTLPQMQNQTPLFQYSPTETVFLPPQYPPTHQPTE
ncbi:Oidioi.mRNA.OKI2018_I69.chr2.g5150.t1.cds [Oikopleura dioica]|uniref:Oidioi.mRNA.OKI2018_I69.chr2.g5150.t1.cds n=1 Tax=Oikopleura dioica TaxID=34765 RepID=A0ABN7T640_OIKDI|nr:Oidioi.mRNA.OKI2018_I69.chr2.g5150.t1.cds [Oikopleura dioica]